MKLVTACAYPFLQKKKLKAIPVRGVKQVQDGYWQAIDHDPQFKLKGVFPKLLSGWMSIQIHITSEQKLAPKLYLDFGEGYSESLTVYMQPSHTQNSYIAELVLTKQLRSIRFDPAEEPCRFTISSIYLSVHSEIVHLSRQLMTLMLRDYRELKDPFAIVRKSHVRYKKHGWTGMIERLEKEYTNMITSASAIKKLLPIPITEHQSNDRTQDDLLSKFKNSSTHYMLFVTHNLGGGTQVAVEMLTEALKEEGISVLFLRQIESLYHIENSVSGDRLTYDSNDFDSVTHVLKSLNVWHIHYHHIIDFSWDILQLPKILKITYDYTFHDYLAICPRVNLTNHQYKYCGEKGIDECEACLLSYGVSNVVKNKLEMVHSDISLWREKMYDFLQEARQIYVPDQDVYERVKRYFVLPNLVLHPHPEVEKKITIRLKPEKVLNIAVIGAIGHIKGFEQLRQCIINAHEKNLPLRFIIIGTTVRNEAISSYPNVTITGNYRREDLASHIKYHQCKVALFLHIWPETFSYTFSEALYNGLYPVAYDIGAISSRIHKLKCGTLLPLESTPDFVVGTLMSMRNASYETTINVGHTYQSILSGYYGLGDIYRREQGE